MKKLSLFLAGILTVAALTACGGNTDNTGNTGATGNTGDTAQQTSADTAAESASSDLGYTELIIGVDDTFAPMGFLDENNELTGFDIELAKAVGEKLGIEMKFQTIEWSMKEQELNQGNIDLIWNGYTITPARQEEVLFTNAYLDNKQVVVVMADSDIQTLEDLAGKVVAAQENSSAIDAMNSKPEIMDSFADLAEFSTNDMAIMDMEAGRADAVVADSVLLEYVISHKDDPSQYRILDEDFGSEEFGIGCRKEDTALCEAINNAIEELKADGTAAEISTTWFGENIVK